MVSTIFFGGGTPSLMQPSSVQAVLDAISKHWTIASGAEITLEANPTSVEATRFRGYRAAGVLDVAQVEPVAEVRCREQPGQV